MDAPQEVAGYRVGALLATGGFAQVYATEGPEPAVLKVPRDRGGSPGTTRALGLLPAVGYTLGSVTARLETLGTADVDSVFRSEAELLRKNEGRQLPRLIAEEEVEGRPLLLLERIEGSSLDEKLSSAGSPPPPLEDWLALLEALTAATESGLPWHGDLKPAHVFFTEGGDVRLIDPAYRAEAGKRTLTPEYNPTLAASSIADTVAVVGMLRQALTGKLPFPQAPAPFVLQPPEPRAEVRKANRQAFRDALPPLELEGEHAELGKRLDEALDQLLLNVNGGDLRTPAQLADWLRAS